MNIHPHHGQETVLNNLRQKLWILRIRQAVKPVSRQCQYCKNSKVGSEIPIMDQLPVSGQIPTIRPFIGTGVDCFGPILVTVKRSHEKRTVLCSLAWLSEEFIWKLPIISAPKDLYIHFDNLVVEEKSIVIMGATSNLQRKNQLNV